MKLAALLGFGALFLPAVAQEPAAEESEVEKHLRLAREGRPVVRPQAARRLLEKPEEAIPLLYEACGQDGSGLADLGKDLILVLGEFGDLRLRALLWNALSDRNFPWRPSAAKSLAGAPEFREAPRFDSMLNDPIALVRGAALLGQRNLERRESLDYVLGMREDQDDRVRQQAAALAADWGQDCSLYWILEDLGREDRFFALQTGKLARFEALKLLKDRLESAEQYSTRKPHDDPANQAALAAMRKEIETQCTKEPQLPDIARAAEPRKGDVLGLELRSCRRGEIFLRWNLDDTLAVGTGNPAVVPLPEGTTAKLLAEAQQRIEQLEGQFWGEPGCDLEQFHFQPDPDARPRAFRVNKGQAAVPNLRPEALGHLARSLAETLPNERSKDPRLHMLRSRVLDALSILGGKLPVSAGAPR